MSSGVIRSNLQMALRVILATSVVLFTFLSVSQSVLLESGPLVEDDHSIVVADQGNPAGQIVTIVPHRRCLGRFVDGHYGGSVVT